MLAFDDLGSLALSVAVLEEHVALSPEVALSFSAYGRVGYLIVYPALR